jgi:hypothetical protein
VKIRTIPLILLAFLAATAAACAASGDAFLNAANFTSLGAFNPSANVLVDLNNGQMSGGAAFQGIAANQAGVSLLVFTFSSFNLNTGLGITFTNAGGGSPAVVFLSQGDMTIAGSINGSGHSGVTYVSDPYGSVSKGGPGGGNGNSGPIVSGYVGPSPGNLGGGYAIGTNTSRLTAGGGGAYGGLGGNAGYADLIYGDTNSSGFGATNSYGPDLSAKLAGGSGGGTGGNFAGEPGEGGGGGGALQIGALGSLTLSGSIYATGGYGGTPFATFGDAGGGGGGSGGGILIQAGNITMSSGATVSAAGGGGGSSPYANVYVGGGGGGGGRISIAYHNSGATNGTINVAGGTGGYGGDSWPSSSAASGIIGTAGTITFVQSALVPFAVVVQPPVITGTLLAGKRLLLSWPSSATNYTLESSATLGLSASWGPVAANIITNGATLMVTNSMSGSAAFFRLHKP